mmetsp:Transcript_35733/g.58314  ORF Transcript_35733/g.58314 Transcript_35733/m.58314 type:complete len:104 (+) Transcript_35733:605-916(+)
MLRETLTDWHDYAKAESFEGTPLQQPAASQALGRQDATLRAQRGGGEGRAPGSAPGRHQHPYSELQVHNARPPPWGLAVLWHLRSLHVLYPSASLCGDGPQGP